MFNHGAASTAASIGANGQVELTQNGSACSGIANGATVRVDAGALSNAGLVTTDGGPVSSSAVTGRAIQGSVTNAGGKITIAANTIWSGATFDNAGTIAIPVKAVLTVPAGTGGDVHQRRRRVDQRAGRVRVRRRWEHLPSSRRTGEPDQRTSSFTNAGFIGLYGDGSPETCTSGRTLSVDTSAGPGTGTLTNTGEIEGYGTIAGNVSNTAGTITPGDTFATISPCPACYATGSITVAGGFTQGPDGTLGISTYGSGAGHTTSLLSVGGPAAIGGTLNMLAGLGSQLVPGEALQVLTAAGVTGTFAKLTGQPEPSYDAQYVPAYKATSVAVSVVRIPKITVRVVGKGSGYVTSVPSGMYCAQGSCVAGFPAGQTMTLIAGPGSSGPFEPVSRFAGWSGAGCHGRGSCMVTMSGDKSVTATFLPPVPPRCTLRLKTRRPKPTLTAIVVCNKGAGLRLTGTVTEWLGRHRRPHTRRFQLQPVTDSTMAGQRTPLLIKLPRPALTALRRGRRETIKLTLSSTDLSGTRRMSTRQLPLHP